MGIFIIVIALWSAVVAGMSQLMCGAAWKRVLIAKLIGFGAGLVFAFIAADALRSALALNLPTIG